MNTKPTVKNSRPKTELDTFYDEIRVLTKRLSHTDDPYTREWLTKCIADSHRDIARTKQTHSDGD